jgi:hypothetical protein
VDGTQAMLGDDYRKLMYGIMAQDDITTHSQNLDKVRNWTVAVQIPMSKDPEIICKWCEKNLGNRYVLWTYKGGGLYRFADQQTADWFLLNWL